MGWPAEAPAQRDWLPGTAWIHSERYVAPTPASIDRDCGEREMRGWERYRAMGPQMAAQMAEHGITSLAQFYTSKIEYDPGRHAVSSTQLKALLQARGFLD